ncbi:hypothetical protein KDL01_37870 [Actinospica durhamensis]|uniref:Uncharacterized protein n=1 Tax=Actinospica durhamensis TaxID=1508375 RepID=A0A941IWD1_9ACTN|nr:hypothetical protein [Actinospica durhamensis]MBR7839096.1 hypothetical protein [Actinospica durhamensis]
MPKSVGVLALAHNCEIRATCHGIGTRHVNGLRHAADVPHDVVSRASDPRHAEL